MRLISVAAADRNDAAVRIELPRDVSLDGHLVDRAIGYLTVTTGIAFAVALGVMLAALILHRARAGRTWAQHTHGNRRRDRALTFAMALILFVGIDVTLAVRANRDLDGRFWTLSGPRPGCAAGRGHRPPVGLVVPDGRPRRPLRHPGRRRHAERAGRPRRPPRLSEAPVAGRGPLALLAQLPIQDRCHSGQHDPRLVPGRRRRSDRAGVRPVLRRQPLQDERPAGRARRSRTTAAGWRAPRRTAACGSTRRAAAPPTPGTGRPAADDRRHRTPLPARRRAPARRADRASGAAASFRPTTR